MATRNVVPRAAGEGSIGTALKPWGDGQFDALHLGGGDVASYLAESTGYGIVSDCTPSIAGLTVTVASGIVHLANGTRKEISASTVTLDAADSTNPRIDLVYIDSTGAVAKVTGTAAASPSAPVVPTNGISVCTVSVAANATAGTVADKRAMLARWYNAGVVNVKDFGAVGDGVTDDTAAIQAAVDSGAKQICFGGGTYYATKIVITNPQTWIGTDSPTINCGMIDVKAWTDIHFIHFIGNDSAPYINSSDGESSVGCATIIFAGEQHTGGDDTEIVDNRYDGVACYDCTFDFADNMFNNGQFKYYTFVARAHSVKNAIFERCTTKWTGLEFRYCTNFEVSDCYLDNNHFGAPKRAAEPIHSTRDCSGRIANNIFVYFADDAIDLYPSSHDVEICGNRFYKTDYYSPTITIKTQFRDSDTGSATNFRKSGIYNIDIHDNYFYDGRSTGVLFDCNCYDDRTDKSGDVTEYLPRNIRIHHNTAEGTAPRFIGFNSGFQQFVVSENIITGETPQLISDNDFATLPVSGFQSDVVDIHGNIVNGTSTVWAMVQIRYADLLTVYGNTFNIKTITTAPIACNAVNNVKRGNNVMNCDQTDSNMYWFKQNLTVFSDITGLVGGHYPFTVEQSRCTIESGGYSVKEDGMIFINTTLKLSVALTNSLVDFCIGGRYSQPYMSGIALSVFNETSPSSHIVACVYRTNNDDKSYLKLSGTGAVNDIIRITGYYQSARYR